MPDPRLPAAPDRRKRRSLPWRRMAVAATFGVTAATGLAPFNLWPVALIGFAGIAWMHVRAASVREAAWFGWAAGAGYFALALSWIVEPFLVDIARHGWMAPFALIFMAGGLALFWAFGTAVAQALAPTGRWRLVAFVAALTLTEALRGVLFTGFPWALIGHVLIASPLIHVAAWTGPDGLTLLTLGFAAGLSRVPASPLRAGAPLALAGAGLLLAAPYLASRLPPTPADAPVMRVMQPNAPQRQKWDPEMVPVFLDRMIGFSATPPAPDVTIWPETSVPLYLDMADGLIGLLAERAQGAVSVLGIERRDESHYYNSLAVVTPEGEVTDVYDKHHLVPFGEYVPMSDLLSRLGLRPMVDRFGGFSPGVGPKLVDLGKAGRALPLICYEAVFPRDVAGTKERPDLLLQITNDAWFGTFSGPYQHLAQARLRAVEQGLPLIRAANTGVSAVIAADGTVVGAIPLGEAGFLDRPKPPAAAPTVFSRTGPWPVLLLALVALVVSGAQGYRRMRTSAH